MINKSIVDLKPSLGMTFFMILVIAILTVLYLTWQIGYGIDYYDTGYVLYPAQQIYQGNLLYKQVQTLYTPAIYYWHAMLFSLFGPHLAVAKWALVLVGATIAICLYLNAARAVSLPFALVPSALFIFWGIGQHPSPHPAWYINGLSLFLLLVTDSYLQVRRRYQLWAASLLVGVIALFKQNMGVFFLIWLLAWVWQVKPSTNHTPPEPKRQISVVLLGSALPLLAFLLYFWSQGALADLLDCTVLSLVNQHQATGKPYSWLNLRGGILLTLFVALSAGLLGWQKREKRMLGAGIVGGFVAVTGALLYGYFNTGPGLENIFRALYTGGQNFLFNLAVMGWIGWFYFWLRIRNQEKDFPWNQRFLLYLTFGLVHLLQLYPRADYSHTLFALPALFLVMTVGIYRSCRRYWFASDEVRLPSLFSIWLFGTLAFFPALQVMHDITRVVDVSSSIQQKKIVLDRWTPVSLPSGDVLSLEPERASAITEMLRFLNERLEPGERIFVYPDETFLYFLLNRETALRRYAFFPGDLSQVGQREVVERLNRWRPNYVIEGRLVFDGNKDFRQTNRLIYGFIQDNYRMVRQFYPENLQVFKLIQ